MGSDPVQYGRFLYGSNSPNGIWRDRINQGIRQFPFKLNFLGHLILHFFHCGVGYPHDFTINHYGVLSNHDLDTRTYRAKYGIPQSQPLAARETAAKQAEALQARQAKDGRTSSKPPSIDGYGKANRKLTEVRRQAQWRSSAPRQRSRDQLRLPAGATWVTARRSDPSSHPCNHPIRTRRSSHIPRRGV